MKRFILLAVTVATMLAVCADRPRKNPLDPKNPDSKRTRAVLVELFTSDAQGYTLLDTIALDSSWTVTETLGIAATLDSMTPGTTITIIDSVVNDSLMQSDTLPVLKALDTVNTNTNDSVHITYYCDTLETEWDTVQYYDSLEILISDAYEENSVVVAEYHLDDAYATLVADTLFNAYQAAATIPAVMNYAAAYFNGTGDPVDMNDIFTAVATHEAAFTSALSSLTGETSYYTLEGDLEVSGNDSSYSTFTGSGKLARLGSDDGDAVIVSYIYTRYLSADHPYVVVGRADAVDRITAPEAGKTYDLSSHTLTVQTAIGEDYANIIVVLQDAATGEIIQAVLGEPVNDDDD